MNVSSACETEVLRDLFMGDGIVEGAAFFEIGVFQIFMRTRSIFSTLQRGCARVGCECVISLPDDLVEVNRESPCRRHVCMYVCMRCMRCTSWMR